MSQAARLFHICRRLATGRRVTAQTLQEELEVGRATVYRDIAVLRDQLLAPIEWDADHESYRFTSPAVGEDAFMVPGLYMEARQLYGLLTTLNVAMALDPGVAMPLMDRFRGVLKEMVIRHRIDVRGLDRKIAVELPRPPLAAQAAMSVIGPALVLDRPVLLFSPKLPGNESARVWPRRLLLRADGWWLQFELSPGPDADPVPGELPLADIVGAQDPEADPAGGAAGAPAEDLA